MAFLHFRRSRGIRFVIGAGYATRSHAAYTVAARVAQETRREHSDIRNQLAVLAKSNLLANTYEALNSVNFFGENVNR